MTIMKMDSINKKFIIKTEDSFGEKTFETVKGSYEADLLGNYRKYFYNSKYGKCEITFINNSITIVRSGVFKSIFEIFFNGTKSKFIYEADILRQELFCLGETFSFDNVNKIFSFSYKLFDINHSELNRISISIKEL